MSSDAAAANTTVADDPVDNPSKTTTTEDPKQTFEDKLAGISGSDDMQEGMASSPPRNRRMSKEWDAAKVPPSQFQKRKGSIYSTPSSRDGHIKDTERDKAYHEKLKEKGWK